MEDNSYNLREYYIYCDSFENTMFTTEKYYKGLLTDLSTSIFTYTTTP